MIPEMCRNNLSEWTVGLISLACWPRRAVGAPYLQQLSYAALLRGSLFLLINYYFSLVESERNALPARTISAQLSPMMKQNTHSASAGIDFELIAGTVDIDNCGFSKVSLLRFNFFFSQSFSANWKISTVSLFQSLPHWLFLCLTFISKIHNLEISISITT